MVGWLKLVANWALIGVFIGILNAIGIFDLLGHGRASQSNNVWDVHSGNEYLWRFVTHPLFFAVAFSVLGTIYWFQTNKNKKTSDNRPGDE